MCDAKLEDLSRKIRMLETLCVLVKCPTTGRILMGIKNDDKVCCGCSVEGTHRIAECEPAMPMEYIDQQERDSNG